MAKGYWWNTNHPQTIRNVKVWRGRVGFRTWDTVVDPAHPSHNNLITIGWASKKLVGLADSDWRFDFISNVEMGKDDHLSFTFRGGFAKDQRLQHGWLYPQHAAVGWDMLGDGYPHTSPPPDNNYTHVSTFAVAKGIVVFVYGTGSSANLLNEHIFKFKCQVNGGAETTVDSLNQSWDNGTGYFQPVYFENSAWTWNNSTSTDDTIKITFLGARTTADVAQDSVTAFAGTCRAGHWSEYGQTGVEYSCYNTEFETISGGSYDGETGLFVRPVYVALGA